MKLSDATVKNLDAPATGNKIHYDDQIKGFGVRITAKGTRAFVLNYRTRAGRERRYTIGSFPEWSVIAARTEAGTLKKRIDLGHDPMSEVEADRNAKTVADLCDRFEADFIPSKRVRTQESYRQHLRAYIRPALKHRKVAEIDYSDIEGLHRKITAEGKGTTANRVVATLSKMFALAVKWRWAPDNPVKSVDTRNPENKRKRYLTAAELERLTTGLAQMSDQQAANIFRLLLLTGARKGEVLSARWEQFDLSDGVWTKPGATTKQKTDHRIPLSAPARQLLAGIERSGDYVFPVHRQSTKATTKEPLPHRSNIKNQWAALCKSAQLVDFKIHDLRHTYASLLVSEGLSLPIIGALLGHTQAQTTHRYAHLMDDPLRKATERAGALISPQAGGQVVAMKGGAA